MTWWKLALLFAAGFVAGAIAWALSDLALLDYRGEADLKSQDIDTTELFDDSPVRELPFASLWIVEQPFVVIGQVLKHFFLINVVAPLPAVYESEKGLAPAVTAGAAQLLSPSQLEVSG